MTSLQWLLLAVGASAIIAYVRWWIRSREEPVAGRQWVAALRASALLLAWLILINPSLPAAARTDRATEIALLDASYSMSRPLSVGGPSIWRAASDSVARFEAVWLFGGDVPRLVRTDSLPTEPLYRESRLVPALLAAAGAGAQQVVVFSDAAIGDATEALAEARRRGMSLSVTTLTPDYPQLGISEVTVPSWVQAGDSAEVRAEIVAWGSDLDSVRIEILDEDSQLQSARWAVVPSQGRFATIRLSFPVADDPGYRRYRVRLAPPAPDPESRDDQRAFYLRVTERNVGPVLVSLQPDWEPSFLIPSLDRLTDVTAQAYLWLADSLVSLNRFERVSLATVQRSARDAPLLVLHGYGADSPAWARALARDATNLLLLPAGPRAFVIPDWDVRLGTPALGEWYATTDLTGTPLALELGGLSLEGLPPLVRVRAVEAEADWVPLVVRRQRRGEPQPAVVVGRAGARRWAVAAAEGFWRWAFRPGAGRQLYRRLWTGVMSWLTAEQLVGGAGLEPRVPVVAWGEALRWSVPAEADSLAVSLLGEGGDTAWSGRAAAGDSLAALLPPGRYRYRARAYQGDRVAAAAAGPSEVEAFAAEVLPPATSGFSASLQVKPSPATAADGGRRGLATAGWPYLVLIALFCAEWALRRSVGLR